MSELLHERVRVDDAGPVGVLTLARPGAGNALDLAMGEALREAADRLARAEAVRVVLLAAEGPVFCVGGDLRELGAADDPSELLARTADSVHAALTTLRELGRPTVTAVQGVAAGGGVGVALAGDLVLVGEGTRFLTAYTAAGLSPDCGVSWRLGRALGPALAADLMLTRRPFGARDAERWGLVSRVVPDAELLGRAAEVAGQLAAGSAPAQAEALRLLRAAPATDWRPHLADEAATISRLAGEDDGREGVAAFLGKRSPAFRTTPP